MLAALGGPEQAPGTLKEVPRCDLVRGMGYGDDLVRNRVRVRMDA